MPTAIHLARSDLEQLLPHRGLNLFIDAVEMSEDGSRATSRTTLAAGCPRVLELLTRTGPAIERVWYEPFLGELLALTGAPLVARSLTSGQVPMFSMISTARFADMPLASAPVVAVAEITRQREAITVFRATASVDGRPIITADVTSGIGSLTDLCGSPVRPLDRHGSPIDQGLFAWKDGAHHLLHGILKEDPVARRLVCSSTYPAHHAFAPGHFPGAPVMMGMSQWAIFMDAVWLARSRFGLTDPQVVAEGSIRRPDGTLVADIRGLMIDSDGPIPRIRETRRIAFRDVIRPGDGLQIEVILRQSEATGVVPG